MVTALALFSGGLDSLLACRVIAAQGIRVIAVKFVTPFFGFDLLEREGKYVREVKEKYGIDVLLRDVSEQYLVMLRNPAHGYGKNFNPCVDCKILLMREARKMMPEVGASFLLSGEVLGQRPMSQRQDTLRIIERDSGCEGILLRPLCAKRLQPVRPEAEGLVDREQLLDFHGRSRTPQMELARKIGITEYPSPAGGCTLTDPVLAKRVERFCREHEQGTPADMRLLLVGRHFHLPRGGWLALGRKKAENEQLVRLRLPGDWLLNMEDRPGPAGILRFSRHGEDIEAAAGLIVRYGKKVVNGPREATVKASRGQEITTLTVPPLADDVFQDWRR